MVWYGMVCCGVTWYGMVWGRMVVMAWGGMVFYGVRWKGLVWSEIKRVEYEVAWCGTVWTRAINSCAHPLWSEPTRATESSSQLDSSGGIMAVVSEFYKRMCKNIKPAKQNDNQRKIQAKKRRK